MSFIRFSLYIKGEKKINERWKSQMNTITKKHPILVLPELADKIGLNEAIFVQQLHYWLKYSKHDYDGSKWVYNTYEEWQKQFTFWSISTIQRITIKLEKMNIIKVGNYNRHKMDKTKWYSINYEMLNEIFGTEYENTLDETSSSQSENNKTQDVTPETATCDIVQVNLTSAIPETTTEITPKKKNDDDNNTRMRIQENPFTFFEKNGFGTIGGYISEKISAWCRDLSDELVIEAMKLAVEYGNKNWKYVETILRLWAERKYRTIKDVEADHRAFKNRGQHKAKDSPNKMGRDIPEDFVRNMDEGEDDE